MFVYAVLLAIGFFGIVGMALAGFVHIGPSHGGAHGVHGHGHVPVGHGHGGHAGHGGHGHTGHLAKGHSHSVSHAPKFSLKSLFSLSPLDIFSYCAGAGVAAFLFRHTVAAGYLPYVAIAGALIFDLCFTRLIMNTISRFSADPSAGLEGSIATPGEAVTNFDSHGQGLIKLTLDGQIVQLLATLEEHERGAGVTVKRGDQVLVVQVDSARNQCLVTREFSVPSLDVPV